MQYIKIRATDIMNRLQEFDKKKDDKQDTGQDKMQLGQVIVYLPRRIVKLLIRGYQQVISPLLPPTCRFMPTCSEYAYEAVSTYGVCKGGWLALKRILKCHPFHPGGYDPLP